MADRSNAEVFNTRSSVLSAINDLVAKDGHIVDSKVLEYVKMYLTLKPENATGEQDLLAALQGLRASGQVLVEEHPMKDRTSARYSQVYQLSSTPVAYRKKMVVTNVARTSTESSLVEYFRRYGNVRDVKLNADEDGTFSAVLEFANPVSVENASWLQHVVDGHVVICKPYNVDRVVEAIPWTSSIDAG